MLPPPHPVMEMGSAAFVILWEETIAQSWRKTPKRNGLPLSFLSLSYTHVHAHTQHSGEEWRERQRQTEETEREQMETKGGGGKQ